LKGLPVMTVEQVIDEHHGRIRKTVGQ